MSPGQGPDTATYSVVFGGRRFADMRILFFAQLREATGQVEVDWPGAGPLCAEALWERLLREFPALAKHRSVVRLARNGAYSAPGETFAPEDEVALIPPVSGG